jgi:5-methylcytosine-specific restriction endonuclease McrA
LHAEGSRVGPWASWEEGFLPLAGEGTPEVAEFSIAEFAAVLGRSTDAGRGYIGDALELAHRLPRIYARTQAGTLEVWRARQIAQATRCLPPAGAAYVDERLVATAHKVGKVTIDRLVDQAMTRFDPDEARARAAAAAESRRVDVHRDDLSHAGLADICATVDLADADDFEAAVARRAAHLGTHGDTDSLDVRRAKALGAMARADLGLDLETGARTGSAGTGVELRVHVDADDLDAALGGEEPASACLARVEKTRSFIHLDALRRWLSRPDLKLSIRQVIDTTATVRVDQYEIPDRLRAQVIERDGHCVFPHCTRPAHRGDVDHITAYEPDGPPGQTSSGNLAALCRNHHRHKTFGGWSYTTLEPGHHLWRTPHGRRLLVTPTGTTTLAPWT